MKRLILAAAAALTLTATQAQDCKVVGDLAERLMQLRQAGGSLSDIMDSPDFSSLTKRMAVDAFKQPRYSTEEIQRRVVADFRNEWEVACYEVRSKKKGDGNV